MKRLTLAVAMSLLCMQLTGQQPPPKKALRTPAAQSQAVHSLQEQIALEMLEGALLESKAIEDPSLRAFTLFQIANAYSKTDREKARNTLLDAFTAATEIEKDDDGMKSSFQGWIFSKLVALGANGLDELMAQAEPNVRALWTSHMIQDAIRKNDYDRAIDLVRQVGSEGDFPYFAVDELMHRLPVERAGDRQTLFSLALAHFAKQKEDHFIVPPAGFNRLVVRFWKVLPPRLVLDAIEVLLEWAKEKEYPGGFSMTVSSAQGSASFDSAYEYQLFLVLPALKELDSSKADRLLRENRSMQAVLERYPQGLPSLDASMGEKPLREGEQGGHSVTYRVAGASAEDRLLAEVNRQAEAIIADAKKNPRQALAAAMTLPETLPGQIMDSPRAHALSGIAHAAAAENESVAKEALREMLSVVPRVPELIQQGLVADAARMYLRMGDKNAARKAVEEGLKLAEKRYANDSDSANPNLAMKAYWHSTDIWRRFIILAAELSPELALQAISEISDKEIQLSQRIVLASSWLGADLVVSIVAEKRKDGTGMYSMKGIHPLREESESTRKAEPRQEE